MLEWGIWKGVRGREREHQTRDAVHAYTVRAAAYTHKKIKQQARLAERPTVGQGNKHWMRNDHVSLCVQCLLPFFYFQFQKNKDYKEEKNNGKSNS